MITLSTQSLFFVAVLIAAPLLIRIAGANKRYIFLGICLLVYGVGIKSPAQAIVAVLWVFVPYFVTKYAGGLSEKVRQKMHIKGALIVVMVVLFSYLMKYDAIFETLHIPYAFGWKLLGLSYFLFRQIDYIMQYEYLKEEGVSLTLIDYLNYLLSFYTLLAGPILRYEEFVADFYGEPEALTGNDIYRIANRIVNGYVKVYVISAILSHYANVWFEGLSNHSGIITAAGAFVIFAFLNGWYIYFNFSGYCDIVIAFAQMAGFTVHENFNQPYLARSVVEFWNRHHITLSEWIRDYIYSPMFKRLISGPCEKNIKLGQYIALFLTFTIAGVWHGTDMNYLIYGLCQGLGIVVATAWKAERKKLLGKERNKAYEKSMVAITAGRCITWMYICLTFSFVGYDVVGLLFK